ncbi:MAG: glycosyltransferase, partial [Acidimicrobiales bacterium]
FLYVGTLDDRLDLDAVTETAARWPHGRVVLVGPRPDPAVLAPVEGLPNVIVHDPVGRAEVAGLISASDVCLLPHRSTPLTRAMSPLKLYEYLGGGARVVASDLPPVRGVDPSVHIVADGASYADAVAAALGRPRPSEAERRGFLAANSWASRHERILDVALAE